MLHEGVEVFSIDDLLGLESVILVDGLRLPSIVSYPLVLLAHLVEPSEFSIFVVDTLDPVDGLGRDT